MKGGYPSLFGPLFVQAKTLPTAGGAEIENFFFTLLAKCIKNGPCRNFKANPPSL